MADTVTLTIKPGVTDHGEQKVAISIGSGYIALDATQLSDLIAALALERAKMQPACPWSAPQRLEKVSYFSDRNWSILPGALGDVLLLHLHHPGYGQMAYGFTRPRYLELRVALNNRVDTLEAQDPAPFTQ